MAVCRCSCFFGLWAADIAAGDSDSYVQHKDKEIQQKTVAKVKVAAGMFGNPQNPHYIIWTK